MSSDLPSYDELPIRPDLPELSSWRVWGDHDVFGTLNLQSTERTLEAVRSVRSVRNGRWFALDPDLERGIVGRAVLADVDRWCTSEGRPIRRGTAVTLGELQ